MSDWIVVDPEILGGKPCIKGTRISVELILELLASGATREEILWTYPQIPPERVDGRPSVCGEDDEKRDRVGHPSLRMRSLDFPLLADEAIGG